VSSTSRVLASNQNIHQSNFSALLFPLVEQELNTYISGVPEFTPTFLLCFYCSSLVFCVVLRKSLYVLFLWAIVLSVLLRFMASDYPFGNFGPLCCLSFFDLWLLITSLLYIRTFFHWFNLPSELLETHSGSYIRDAK
jgi:hypothetical protein